MRVCDERLGVKRDEPPDGLATEGTRRLAHLIFHPRNFHIISALGRAIPAGFIVARADEVTGVVLLAAVHMSLPGTKRTFSLRRSMSIYWGKADIQQTSPNVRV